jgi:hypothetical protein
VLTQSARLSTGNNVVAFNKLPLSNPSYFKDYVYSINSKEMGGVSVLDANTKNIEIKI